MKLDLSKGVWYPLVIGATLLVVTLFMPKRLSWKEIYITYGVIGWLTWMLDHLTGSLVDLFDLGSGTKTGIGDIVTYSIIPSAFAVLFLNFYKSDRKWWYVVGFTILSFLFEWGMVQVGFMKLHLWRTWYSIPFYLLVYGFYLPWHLQFIRGESKESSQEPKRLVFFLNFFFRRNRAR